MFFKSYGSEKTKSTSLLIKYSVLTILIKWTNLFRIESLNVTERCPVKEVFLNIFQNSLKDVRVAVFTLIKFQSKGLQLYWKETLAYVHP